MSDAYRRAIPAHSQWQVVRDLYHRAQSLSGAARGSFLQQECGDDSALHAEVEALLGWGDRAGSFLECPSSAAVNVFAAAAPLTKPATLGTRIGAYTIRGVLGAGGMGIVYEVEQASPRRTVALKLMRAMPFQDELTARLFRREGQALARLQHPGIASIYEAGQSDDGWHYFAMERVQGTSLHEFARQRNLSLRDRLALFGRICDAVHYAHQRGVIHRDLKPSNILVTDAGQPKILDFGLARIIDPDADMTQVTQPGAFLGTLAYASPEQTRGRPEDIDARSDVYSLGVILYELLTDRLPYDVRGATLTEAARRICEFPPAPVGSIRRALRGDLETIVAKALEKERDRRYQSAAELVEDIGHYLAREPIRARPSSTFYLLQRFTARHRLAAGLVGVIALLTAAYAIVATVQAFRLRDERNRASLAFESESRARKGAEEVVSFLESLFTQIDPTGSPTSQPTVRDLIDSGAARLKTELKDHASRARLLTALGRVYSHLGITDVACKLMKEAETLQASSFGVQSPEYAAALMELGLAYRENGDFKKAEPLLSQACELTVRLYGENDARTADAFDVRGSSLYYSGKAEPALHDFQRSLQIRRTLFGPSHRSVAQALSNIAMAHKSLGRPKDADLSVRESLAIRRELHDDRAVALSLDNLAQIAFALGDFKEAEKALAEEVEVSRRIFRPDHPRLAWALNNYAFMVKHNSGPAAAIPIYREALAIRKKAFGDEHLDVSASYSDLGTILSAAGAHDEAIEQLKKALAIRRTKLGARHKVVGVTLFNLAMAYHRASRLAEAEPLMAESLKIEQEHHPSSPHAQYVMRSLLSVYEGLNRREDAARLKAILQEAKPGTVP